METLESTNSTPNKSPILREIISIDLDRIDFDEKDDVKSLLYKLINFIEQLLHNDQKQKEEIQKLKDEINRLKGEKGKPKIKPNVPIEENMKTKPKKSKKWRKRSKKSRVKIDNIEVRKVDKNILPQDAEFKGYAEVIKQNIKFETDNTLYRLEIYYSPSEKKTYRAELPKDVKKDVGNGEFRSDLKAFIMHLYFVGRVTEPKIMDIFEEKGVIISKGQISNILTKEKQEEFTKEKSDIFKAGFDSSDYFHTDDTGARHKGINHHLHVICNTLFSVFFITRYKNRNEIKNILGLGEDEKIKDKVMITDDARQYFLVALLHALCWIHEIRHFIKLNPFLEINKKKLFEFLTEIWKFYKQLEEYKENPDELQKGLLGKRFDELFSTKTGYEQLDDRIELTRKKKVELLLVLDYPMIPLHNNPAEIAVREGVLKRKISYGTRSEDGKIAWENMLSIMDTCRKNKVSFFAYVKDIFSGKYEMPRLAELIEKKTLV